MQTPSEQILVVEDDPQIRSFVCFALKNAGYSYALASSAQDALTQLVTGSFDLMLLDLGLPDFDGMQVIAKVRSWSQMPILVISARDQDTEKAAALDAGADDYLTKPFSATELMARIRVSLRHLYQAGMQKTQTIASVRGLKIDFSKRLVYLDEGELHVTPLEYSLLALFFHNVGKVLTNKMIIREIYGSGYGTDTQALRALMAGLRRKIELNPAVPKYIQTEIGVGYRLIGE